MKRNKFVRQEPPNLAMAVRLGFAPRSQEFHFMASPCGFASFNPTAP